jgi:hypothetical protein
MVFTMSNLKNNKKENNIERDLKENTERNLDLQRQQQQIENTTNNISSNINNSQSSIFLDKSQEEIRKMYENNIERINQFQKQIIDNNKELSTKYIELQKNVINTFRSNYGQTLETIYNSYWNNFRTPERYTETYNTINKNVSDDITNRINFINEIVIGNTESFNKSIESAQRYFDTIQNYFNYIRNLERFYNK